MYYSVIDIGSNTVKCEIFEYIENKLVSKGFVSRQLGIIARIKEGVLPKEDIILLCETLSHFKSECKAYNTLPFCFATESLRKASNLDEIKENVKQLTDIYIDLIPGRDEALLSFKGFIKNTSSYTQGIMADMGGGSTEILSYEDSHPIELNSFKFGCLWLKKKFVKSRFPSLSEENKIDSFIRKELGAYPWIRSSDTLCIIGGTGTAIEKLALKCGFEYNGHFTKEGFRSLYEFFRDPSEDKIRLLEEHIPARVETILPGMCALLTVADIVSPEKIYISKDGIRSGYIYRILEKEEER
ncbi:MAG: hypothetical protein E7591_00170 [Ruminococcaceae bacterium]|nr:hypothetical protein [Oscillospiraceae bacterium]